MRLNSILVLAFLALLASGCDIIKQTSVEQSVAKALNDDPRTKDYKFEVSLPSPGHVLITGTVGTLEEVDAITDIAQRVKGVTEGDSRRTVEQPGSPIM